MNVKVLNLVVLAGLLTGCAPTDPAKTAAPDVVEPARSTGLGVWYGPATLNTVTRGIRDDFMEQFTDIGNWPTVYRETAVFKQFIETLGGNKYSDTQLKELATFTREAGLKCAFEIGALRWTPEL
jgi:hypothetical protein